MTMANENGIEYNHFHLPLLFSFFLYIPIYSYLVKHEVPEEVF